MYLPQPRVPKHYPATKSITGRQRHGVNNGEMERKISRHGNILKAALLASTMVLAPHLTLADSSLPLPTGQFITPTAPTGAVQQFLNPGLVNYPNFVANEAVRSQLSPDGTTLLILCAGYNNNLDKTAQNDLAASNQYIFVYNVAGASKSKPVLSQVIQQFNSYVGLVWAPDASG